MHFISVSFIFILFIIKKNDKFSHYYFLFFLSVIHTRASFDEHQDTVLRALPLLLAEIALARIDKRRMEATLVCSVRIIIPVEELLKDENLVGRHVWVVAPLLGLVVLDTKLWLRLVGRGDAVQLSKYDVVTLDGAAIEDTQWVVDELALHLDRSPEADHGHNTAFSELGIELFSRFLRRLLVSYVSGDSVLEMPWCKSIVLVNTTAVEIILRVRATPEHCVLLINTMKLSPSREQLLSNKRLDLAVIDICDVCVDSRMVLIPIIDTRRCLEQNEAMLFKE